MLRIEKLTAIKDKLKSLVGRIGQVDKKNILLFVCVLLALSAAVFLAWVCSVYFGLINTRFYTVTALGNEWKLRMKEDSRVCFSLSDGSMEPPIRFAQDFAELRDRVVSGHLDSISDPDLTGELSMPNLAAVDIKAPKGYKDQDAWAITYYAPHHISDADRTILVTTKLVSEYAPVVEFHLMTESAFWEAGEAGYSNYTEHRGESFGIISREKISDRNAYLTKYSDGEWWGAFLQYTLTDMDTTLYVTEEYKINHSKRTATSKWAIYGIDGGYHFVCGTTKGYEDVSEDWQPERPSEEFLMQFGVQRKMQPVVVAVVGVIGAMAATYVTVALCKRRRNRKGREDSDT